jgi:hypothetical protein
MILKKIVGRWSKQTDQFLLENTISSWLSKKEIVQYKPKVKDQNSPLQLGHVRISQ